MRRLACSTRSTSSVHDADVHNRDVRYQRGAAALLIAICAAYGVHAVVTRPPTPITQPDTAYYVEGSPVVSVGYPLFLDAVGVSGAAILQPLFFATALAALSLEVLTISRSLVVALTITVGILVIPDMRQFHVSVLTESLFIAGLMGFLTATTRFARVPSWRSAAAAALIAGLTFTVRRTALALEPVAILMVLLHRRQLQRRAPAALVASLLPFVAVLAADRVVAQYKHGDALTSLTGRHLFAKAALIDAPPQPATDALDAQLARELEVTFAPVRALIASAPANIRASLSLYYETCLQGPCMTAIRNSMAVPEAEKNARLAAAGLARVRAAPLPFLSLTLRHYGSLWTVYKVRHPDRVPVLEEYLAAHRPLPFEREAFKVSPAEAITFAPSGVVRLLQPLVVAVGVLTGVVALAGVVAALLRKSSPVLVAAALASLSAHACLMLSALGAAGISRFMVAIFPAVVVGLGLTCAWGLRSHSGEVEITSSARYH
jgi:hypothetical protein